MKEHYDHKLPFYVEMLAPDFPYHAHDGFSKLLFALIVGLVLAGILYAAYVLLSNGPITIY